jgi:phosphatidate phosphatase APP1
MPVLSPRTLYHRLLTLLRFLARPVRRGGRGGGRVIHTYRGYGSRTEVFLMGRVFLQPGLGLPLPGPIDDLVNILRRTLRWGVRDARLWVRVGAAATEVVTDADGYFSVHLKTGDTLPDGACWRRAELTLLPHRHPARTPPPAEHGLPRAAARIYIPAKVVDLGVISDIDDTVIYTGVASKVKMMYRLFVQRANHRTAFPGVSALYRGLFRGREGQCRRPLLYVSRGPWSIYEVLEEFFRLHRIPYGPVLFLREWGVTVQRPLPRRAREHKAMLIRRMLGLYPGVPFILIGDSGQRDPEVYAQIVAEHPGRIRAIYIRHVHTNPTRDRDIQALTRQVAGSDCEMLLADDSLAMAEHAFARGFIHEHALAQVREESQRTVT